MRALVIGCGFVGSALAAELARGGHEVVGVRRSPQASHAWPAGVEHWQADISRSDFVLPPGRFDWVVFTASAAAGTQGPDAYRAVYLDGTRNVLDHLRENPPARYVYTGSTTVYAQQDGSVVKENSPAEPVAAADRTLLDTENLLLEAVKGGFPAVILRVARIYGPDRDHLLERFVRNETRIPGHGHRFLNMIHRDDVVGAIVATLRSGRPGEIYNVVDQEPVTEVHYYTWLAETLGKWVPPFSPEEADPERVRLLANRRVSSRRLTMELGCRLKYPTFRQGLTAEIKRLTDAGLLDIAPEQR